MRRLTKVASAIGALMLAAVPVTSASGPPAKDDQDGERSAPHWLMPGEAPKGSDEHNEMIAATAHDEALKARMRDLSPALVPRFLLDNAILQERTSRAVPGTVMPLGDLSLANNPGVRIVGRQNGVVVTQCSGILVTTRLVGTAWHCTVYDSKPVDEFEVIPSSEGINGCRRLTTKTTPFRFSQVAQAYQAWDVAILIFDTGDRFLGCNTYGSVNAIEADSSGWKKYDYAWTADLGAGSILVTAGKAKYFYRVTNGNLQKCGPDTRTKCPAAYIVCFRVNHGATETQLKQWGGHSGAAIRRIVNNRLTVVHAIASQTMAISGDTYECGSAINQKIEDQIDKMIKQYR